VAVAEALGVEGLRVIALSPPGYLRPPLETGARPEAQADATAALLDELALEQVAVLSGPRPAARPRCNSRCGTRGGSLSGALGGRQAADGPGREQPDGRGPDN